MLFTILIPAYNEEGSIEETVVSIISELENAKISYEILVVNDHSNDSTEAELLKLKQSYPNFRYVNNHYKNGIGLAIKAGLDHFKGDAVAIVMADGSDFPEDIVSYYRELEAGFDCVFGSRFIKKGEVIDYPFYKLIINRMANWFIRIIFNLKLNDITNAFKAYRREVIDGVRPLLSHHFNITVELPLKSIVRKYSYTIIPIKWKNRKAGISKLKLQEMGSRYLFIVLYVFLEKMLSKGDYFRTDKKK